MSLSTQSQASEFELLTGRERTVAALVGRGLRNREIAEALKLSEGTVKLHVHKILQKLNFSSRRSLYFTDNVQFGNRDLR
jgi:two-component system nitrate/nitrite response regulator NarL